MKKLVFCFDGTWNKIESDYPTNVARIAQAVSHFDGDGTPQIVHYDEGVGTSEVGKVLSWIGNRIAGGFGLGLQQNIVEAYTFLILNYDPGDQIYVFGFSRGAITARSFVGLLRNSAVMPRRYLGRIREAVSRYIDRSDATSPNSLDSRFFRYQNCPDACLESDLDWLDQAFPEHDHRSKPRLQVEYLGVWDTVGALGVPKGFGIASFINRKFQFHDTTLTSFVSRACHAVAADELRGTFEPTMWTNLSELNQAVPGSYQQKIFPGTHSSVGGGGPIRGLSDAALEWIYRGARDAGLAFDTDVKSPLFGMLPDHRAPLHNEIAKHKWSRKDKLLGSGLKDRTFPALTLDDLHASVVRRWHDKTVKLGPDGIYRPSSLWSIFKEIEEHPPTTDVTVDAELFEGIRSSDGGLDPPVRVEKYTIRAQDTLPRIAEQKMGDPKMWKALFLHNFRAGILFHPNELHALREIEIPFFIRKNVTVRRLPAALPPT